ncbi:MAG: hypothetical protein HY560_08205, partial [Gemmatimonadetes bacterium]|nr:hypothetical protein [Gemmatimonadota bacterium]
SPGAVVRGFMAAGTVVFALVGLLRGDGRWYAASGAFGVMWWGWDFLMAQVFDPLGEWFSRLWTGGAGGGRQAANLRPTLDDTIRLLERHLRPGVARSVVVQAAIRLEEIYRTIKNDPARAREVIVRARALVPDAAELDRYERET